MNMQKITISKTTSEYKILDSGSVITFNSSADLSFSIDIDTFHFNLVIKFESEEGGKRELRNNLSKESSTITLTCINFDNPLGTATKTAIELATVGGKKVYINFEVSCIDKESPKNIIYTLYSEK